MQKKQTSPLEILCVIVRRGHNPKVAQILKEYEVTHQINCLAEGTSKSNVQSIFGFAITERDVMLALIKPKKVKGALKALQETFMTENGEEMCIAFTVPISSATSTMLDMMGIKY